ncbi:MAG: hypothetical protein ACF8R7_16780 [Phycisphaerales bacterium JB039]
MSIRFVRDPNQLQIESLRADDGAGGDLAPTLPLTALLWLRFESVPGASETWTVWWYGERARAINALTLYAQRSTGNKLELAAKLVGVTGSVTATSPELDTEEWHQVAVALKTGVSEGNFTIELYVDDLTVVTATASATISESDWGVVSMGARTEANIQDPGGFRAEHFAIWNAAISSADFQEMYEEKIAPWDADLDEIGLDIGAPSVAYWPLIGHTAGGIPILEAGHYAVLEDGELRNYGAQKDELGRPRLDWHSGDPEWSAYRPAIRYLRATSYQPLGAPPKAVTRRRDPLFGYFNFPSLATGTAFAPGAHPMYTDPNFVVFSQINAFNPQAFLAPRFIPPIILTPASDIGLAAKRIADWQAMQGFTKGTGSAGGGDYEGIIYLKRIGDQDWEAPGEVKPGEPEPLKLGLPRGFEGGYGRGIPLGEHPLDAVGAISSPTEIDPRYKWSTWFRANGERLVKEYYDHFWPALKAELDARDLCYPKRLFWDYESFPRNREALRVDNAAPTGNFTPQLEDARAATEQLAGSSAPTTLEDIFDDWGGTYTDLGGTLDPDNFDFFTQFWEPWSVVIRQHALAESIFATAKDVFPETKWGNYWGYRADNPEFTYPEDLAPYFINTPSGVTVPGDYAQPKLYSRNGANLRGTEPEMNLGMDYATVVRRLKKARIEACVNAQSPLPLAPWFESFGHSYMFDPSGGDPVLVYRPTAEDFWSDITFAWQRGCDEFMIFSWEDGAYDATFFLCKRLVNWLHFMPVASYDRTARVSRLGRR